MSILKAIVLANAMSLLALVAGHGSVIEVTKSTGEVFEAEVPSDPVYTRTPKPNQPVWEAGPLKEWGTFVPYTSVNNPDIICHVAAKPGPGTIRIGAGEDLKIRWNMWPKSHPGYIMNYLANCNGPCQDAKKEDLMWFKISEGGLVSGNPPAGEPRTERYVTDDLVDQGNSSSVKIPDVAPGFYALRHELISLHQTDRPDREDFGAQFYPYCISLEITGSGTARPAGVRGTELYRVDELGFNVNVYVPVKNLTIPGPPLAKFESGLQSQSDVSSSQASTSEEAMVMVAASADTSASDSAAPSLTPTSNQVYELTTAEPTTSSSAASSTSVLSSPSADVEAGQTTSSPTASAASQATSPSTEQAPESYFTTPESSAQETISSGTQDLPSTTAAPTASSQNTTETRQRDGRTRTRGSRIRKVFRCSTGFSTVWLARPTGYA